MDELDPEVMRCERSGCAFYTDRASIMRQHDDWHAVRDLPPLTDEEREYGLMMARDLLAHLHAGIEARKRATVSIGDLFADVS